ncbi:MAG: histone deacetylase family protein [Lautropia sp.]|nr:histone deacetylase family protein [Lautropia sp.]
MDVAYISHSSSALHEMGEWHPESPDRVRVISDRLYSSGLIDLLTGYDAPEVTREQLLRVHSQRYLDYLERVSPSEGYFSIDTDTMMNPHTLRAAKHAAGAAVKAVDLVMNGEYRRVFCNVRPPGHHATRHSSMGFCFYNNAVVGMYHALEAHGLKRVALFDFDVHHGNGSEDILAGDERTLMLSTFQPRIFPHHGELPLGPNILSVPLPGYSNGKAMREAVREQWGPALDAFEPELIFISAGFDAHRDDDLGQLGWTTADYAWITHWLMLKSMQHCGGRVVSMLEGGYSLQALSVSVEQHVRELLEIGLTELPA